MSQHSERVGADAAQVDHASSASAESATVRRASSAAPAQPAAVLTVGHAEDPMERLADSMADRAVASLDASEPHRHTPGCGHLRRSVAPSAGATVGLEGGDLDTDASSAIERARGGGRALPSDVRRRMEGAFGTSLGHVRVHDGPEAAKLSSAMQASAFTTGSDVFFGAGQFDPSSREGEHVLAHELAHVVTEGPGGVRRMVIRRGIFDKVKSVKAKLFGSTQDKEKVDAVASSKQVEKQELKNLQEDRNRGTEQRASTQQSVYGDGPATAPENESESARAARNKAAFSDQGKQWQQVQELNERFRLALMLEREEFAALKAKYAKANVAKEDEEIAQEAYDRIWLEHVDEELRAHRPARETAAERLVAQVRQVRSGANAQQENIDNVEALTKRGQMLSKTVEEAYEVMVVRAGRLQRTAERKGRQPISDADARAQVREVGVQHCAAAAVARKHKKPREMPEPGSALDDAAWEAAKERVEVRGHVKQKKKDDFERLQAQLGGKADWGDVAGGAKIEKGASIGSTVGGLVTKGGEETAGAPEKISKIKAFFTGKKSPEAEDRDEFETPRDTFEQATDGVTASGNIITNLAGAVQEALTMARQIKDAYRSKDPWQAVKATKSGLGAVDSLAKGASECANLAKSIEPTLSKSVASVIPGLGLVSAVTDTAKASLDVAMAGRRQHETNSAMFEARARTTGDQADVLVWPLMKMSQAHTKSLENNVWTLGKSVFDLVTSIGELATAGGLGIPAAVKTGNKVIDKLHSLGHFIADEIITRQAQRAEKDSAVLHLEGAAQDELRHHPKMAADAIILRAVHGDDHAMAYVCNYWVDGKPVTPELVKRIDKVKIAPAKSEMTGDKITATTGADDVRGSDDIVLNKIRAAMLEDMNMVGDPQTALQVAMGKVKEGKGLFGYRDKWRTTGEMAQTRNAHAGDEGFAHDKRSDRGFGWRLKMMLKGDEKFGRSVAKTQVLQNLDAEKAAEEKARRIDAGEILPDAIACAVGDKMLLAGSTYAESETFFSKLSEAELEAELAAEEARPSPRNGPGWLALIKTKLDEKRAAKAAQAGSGGAGSAPAAPSTSSASSASSTAAKVTV